VSRPSIRTASPADAEPLGRLAAALVTLPLLERYGVTAPGLHADLLRLLPEQPAAAPDERLLVAEQPGPRGGTDPAGRQLCGLARFALRGQLGRGGYLRLIALAPGTQGQGLGSLLLAEVERQVALSSPELFLLTSDFNTAAQRFYERHGYARVGQLADYVRPGITELLYRKRVR
jgi:ribosomal protein S18 acetylase RimI-like enzyme